MNGQKAVIIGGTSGIGHAVAQALSQRRIEVEAIGRSTGFDITDHGAIEAYFQACGPIDHVVVTAGSQAPGGTLVDLELDRAKAAFDTKFWGSITLVQAASSHIRPGGTITLTSGFLARRTVPGTFVKTAMNAALEASAKIFAKELAPIRVNVISPGLTETEAYSAMSEEARMQMYTKAAATLPAGRVAQPRDLAAGYLFVIDNPSVTGAVIDIDGGALIN